MLVIRGEAGVGKSTLLRYCAEHASEFQIRRATGVESEMELPYAALHQLCAPMLDGLPALPQPQQAALEVALGLAQGDPPERFLVALAALSLVSEAGAGQPLLCVVDDAQWLDTASRQAFGFMARRLLADPVAMVFAVRTPAQERDLDGLPVMLLEGLADSDAQALLDSVILRKLDGNTRDRLLAEARGNPLALLELPHRMSPAQLPGALGHLAAHELPTSIEASFIQRLDTLPDEARLLLLVAAAEPADDSRLLWDAARQLGIDVSAASATEATGLLTIDEHVRFRHPLVRSAAYRSASPHDRRRAHLALADSVDASRDADRRAWHLAAATAGPDEQVAQELEASADRARARGGLVAAAAFLRRSVVLTEDPDHRAERALSAARASLHAGQFDAALDVLATAENGALDRRQQGRVELLRGQVVLASGAAGRATGLLLAAAQRLEPIDPELAREAYLDAWSGAVFAGTMTDTTMRDVSYAVKASPLFVGKLDGADLLLVGLSSLMIDGRAAAAPTLRSAVRAFLDEPLAADKGMRWSVIASSVAVELWDYSSWEATLSRQMQVARETGALAALAINLSGVGVLLSWSGDLDGAARVGSEMAAICEATGTQIAPYGGMLLAALRGRESESVATLESVGARAAADGDGAALQCMDWAMAMLCNGLGRYEEGLEAAQRAWETWPDWLVSVFALVELVEAAVRLERTDIAVAALERLVASTQVSGSEWALGIAARSTALLEDGAGAETLYQEAIEHLETTPLRPELARAHLVYGEWLRREGRRVDARAQLGLAHSMFTAMGAEAFAERTRLELAAAGDRVAEKRTEHTRSELTVQEAHIARLAADGRTNVQIGTQLYLSRHTIEWHLRKVFHKLGIRSRWELRDVLGGDQESDPTLPAHS